MTLAVVGGGIFGVTASLALRKRGCAVTLYEAGSAQVPEAASNDINKLVRMDYGRDVLYRDLGIEAISGWEHWNRESGRSLYHPDGILVLASRWEPGGFERDSCDALEAIGVPLHRFEAVPLDVWRWQGPGYINPSGGWAESAAALAWLREQAIAQGVSINERSPIVGPTALDALAERFDAVVVAAGAWSTALVPQLTALVQIVGQPTLYLRPEAPSRFRPPHFLPFACDIASSGWYGFPANRDGLVKIANHGPGTPMPADAPRTLGPEWDDRLTLFLEAHLPELARAPIVSRKWCLYTDIFDGNFIIDRLPDRPRAVLATGGSGHAFKFAPVLGNLVADRVMERDNPRLARFAWRSTGPIRPEQARSR